MTCVSTDPGDPWMEPSLAPAIDFQVRASPGVRESHSEVPATSFRLLDLEHCLGHCQVIEWQYLSAGTPIAIAPYMFDWDRIGVMCLETGREGGLLVIVFLPLEATFSGISVARGAASSIWMAAALATACAILIQGRKS